MPTKDDRNEYVRYILSFEKAHELSYWDVTAGQEWESVSANDRYRLFSDADV